MLLPKCFSLFTFTIIGVLLTNTLASPMTIEEFRDADLAIEPCLDLSGLLSPPSTEGQVCGPVTGANVRGECLDSGTTCCLGFYTRGFCPGGANIRCCTRVQRCSSGGGYCNDVNHVSCSVPYIANLCPGPTNVRCCRGSSGGSFCTPGGG